MTTNEKIEKKCKELYDIAHPQTSVLDITWENHKTIELPDYIQSYYRLARHVLTAEIETKMDCLRSINFEFTLKIYNQVKELEQQLADLKNDK